MTGKYSIAQNYLRCSIDKTGELGDADTADLYTEISRTIDKRLWFLEAHLQGSVTIAAAAAPEKVAVK